MFNARATVGRQRRVEDGRAHESGRSKKPRVASKREEESEIERREEVIEEKREEDEKRERVEDSKKESIRWRGRERNG